MLFGSLKISVSNKHTLQLKYYLHQRLFSRKSPLFQIQNLCLTMKKMNNIVFKINCCHAKLFEK